MTSYYKAQGKTLTSVLESLYEQCGYYLGALASYIFNGSEGNEHIASVMAKLRVDEKAALEGVSVFTDYREMGTGLLQSDVRKYCLSDDFWVAMRPSGTERKLKIYYSVYESAGSGIPDKQQSECKLNRLRATIKNTVAPGC